MSKDYNIDKKYKHKKGRIFPQNDSKHSDVEAINLYVALTVYLHYMVLIVFGSIRDFFGEMFGTSRYLAKKSRKGFAEILVSWENFYTKRFYHRIQDVFNRPVSGSAGVTIDVYERFSNDGNKTLRMKDVTRHCINLGSYNYLGFADDWISTCSKPVLQTLEKYGSAVMSSSVDYGTTPVHQELERMVADYVGKPAAMIFNMGYATNSTTIPALMGKGCLIVSDSLNHASIVNGSRSSEAIVRVFEHNNPGHLEDILRREIAYGQPKTHRPWKKVLVMVEGIYSMEGEACKLKDIVAVCKRYKSYLYVDEAHSIGALGKTGRGICEYSGVDPADVDILMGTFTKSFAGMGGYIASSENIISKLRSASSGSVYGSSMSPVVAQQIVTTLKIIQGLDGSGLGKIKLNALRDNSNYFRKRLNDMGLVTLGDPDSPVIPVMLYSLAGIAAFSRECFKRNLAVVTVGFPATPLLESRVRFCISAAHTREMLDDALKKVEEVCRLCRIRYRDHYFG